MTSLQKGRSHSKVFITKTILLYEAIGFLAIIALAWANEVFDIPYLLLGSPTTEVNVREAAFESGCVLILGIAVMAITRNFLNHIKYLEGFVVVCAFCKRIRIGEDKWIPMEEFVTDRAEVEFSHAYCPICMEEHYGHLFPSKNSAA
jgi:hypothetical protein